MENNKRPIKIYNHTELGLDLLGQVLAQLYAEEMQYEERKDGSLRTEMGGRSTLMTDINTVTV